MRMSAGIESLTVKGFKGFRNEITIDFTSRGKNLVIYGENGSGKTSIMKALKVLLDSSVDKIKLEKYKNIFSSGDIEIKIRTTDGKNITLKTRIEKRKDGRSDDVKILVTSPEDYDSDVRTYLEAISKSTTILSYKELMKVFEIRDAKDFYKLFIEKIMRDASVPPQYEEKLYDLINEYNHLFALRHQDGRKVKKEKLQGKEDKIKKAINSIFTEIKDKWNEHIKTLTGDNIEVECSIEQLGSLNFKIKWNGKDVCNIMNYLNEGRLNAVALGLFLAYYKKFNVSPYKLLLLDDVVIGLDMSLRLPLLKILQKDFEEDYQIIMTTFDENWFNLMKNYLDGSKWEFIRLIIKFTDSNEFPFIIGIQSSDYLGKAKHYYENDDIPAAALYTRLEFERLIIKYAEKKKLKIQFRRKTAEISINEIWNIVAQNLPRSKTLCQRIDTYKSILLNPSVHYDQRPRYRNEVKYAIDAVRKLKEKISRELK